MPRFNGTGPLGSGPGTGWNRGPCGGGKGWFGRFWGQPKITEKEETEILEDELKDIKQRLEELKGKK